jgi:kelch-like protein 2/3
VQNQNVNHYENVDAVQALGVPAINEPNVAQIVNLQQNRAQQYHPGYRNDIYDRTGGYDIPRNIRSQNYYANIPVAAAAAAAAANGTQRRSNLHLDFRCPSNHQHKRSFDDTESCYYGSNSGYGMYERIRDEPVYQNSTNNSVYGRLDVIGHGIGRIERHLSSSCGNIDHYNVGGHYAVLSHSHVNPVMNQNQISTGVAQNSRDGVKSLFSCLGGENSQSLNSIHDNNEANSNATQPSTSSSSTSSTAPRSTGAIPKLKAKQSNKVSPKPSTSAPPSTVASTDLQKSNFSKSSLQYLVMNKWLPLPLGSDYKLIDFNFMFSRNCTTGQCNTTEGVVQFNGQAEMIEPGVHQPPREYPMMNNGQYPRIIRNTPQLSRLRESEAENGQNENYRNGLDNNYRARSESPIFNGIRPQQRPQQDDPFQNWSFNFENNSFKPANVVGVKRITDGTLAPKDYQEQNPRKELPNIYGEIEINSQDQPTTSKSSSPSTSENSNLCPSTSSSMTTGKTSEMKKSENYDNLASLQQDPLPSTSGSKNHKKKSTESSSDSVTLAEEDNDDNDPFDELESDID